ncbi:ribosomal L28e/Mak16 [Amanita rubescens]|nr:ribosomal L28e/Mak16 [Amanita rubescens]
MSNDLQWLLLRNYNSYKVKRVPEGPIFSKEPGNLFNLHSHKYSGFANQKVLSIHDSKNGIQIQTRKTKASPHQVKSGFATTSIKARTGPRRALGIAAGFARRGYRPDLRRATLARVSALVNAQKEPKPARPKKLRGKKKAAVTKA